MRTTYALFVMVACLAGCQKKPEAVSNRLAIDLKGISSILIKGADLKAGERVLMIGRSGPFDSLEVFLSQGIKQAGATYLGTLSVDSASWPESWKTEFTDLTALKSRTELAMLFEDVDLGVMLPGASPADIPYAAMQDVLKKGKARTIHFHWSGAFNLGSGAIQPDSSMSLVYETAVLETDYSRLSTLQNEVESILRKDVIRVTTPAGTNIQFSIGDRPVTKQDGDASMARSKLARNMIDREIEIPAGAIRVAPLEETVSGTIVFPDATWGSTTVENLVMTFRNGKAVEIGATKGGDEVKTLLAGAGSEAASFRELAIGFNPLLTVPTENPWIPYYGYGAGVVRLSLGDNEEVGGKVRGGWARVNYFVDATVIVGKDTLVRNGLLLKKY